MILREFLYVDTDKVRGLLAQLDGGILEAEREATRSDKISGAGAGKFLHHEEVWGSERSVQKSLGDAMFPTLEEALEAQGILRDISRHLTNIDYWTPEQLHVEVPPGSIVRITAPGAIFDARYVAATFAGFATAYQGLQGLGAIPTMKVPGGKRPQQRKNSPQGIGPQLEDAIPQLGPSETGFSDERMRAIIRIARGVFAPGLHMNLFPTEDERYSLGARLQEGRHFLDSDSDILFARYGVGLQEWTVVGTIGHYASSEPPPDLTPDFMDIETVRRAKMANVVNRFLQKLGTQGFTDLPQYPAFSIVPLAVYRLTPTLGKSDGAESLASLGNAGSSRPKEQVRAALRACSGTPARQ